MTATEGEAMASKLWRNGPVMLTLFALLIGTPASAAIRPEVRVAATTTSTLAQRLTTVSATHLVNYYPADAGWTAMWTAWNPTRIDADLARAASIGADGVRVIVFPDTFGFPVPQATFTNRLQQFVGMAAAHKMTVKLTLFDWWDRYQDIAGSTTWAKSLLAPYAKDPRVLTVELKNEMDPTNNAAMNWARAMIPVLHQTLPNTPITATVAGSAMTDGLRKLKAQLSRTPLDYYDYHFYGNSASAYSIICEARGIAAPAPLVIGEVGISSVNNADADQAAYLARVLTAASTAGVKSVAPWTLNDFLPNAIPSTSAVAHRAAEYRYGLYRTDGTPKAAATAVRNAWAGGTASESSLNVGFEGHDGIGPWRPYLPQFGLGVQSTSVAHSGGTSVMFRHTGGSSSGMPSVRLSPIDPVRAGQPWRAQVWARGSNATGTNRLALSWFDAAGRYLGENSSAPLPAGDTDWTLLVAQANAPANAAALEIHLKSGNNAGTAWFDDVSVSD
jgi:hypothetical protein